MSGDSSTDERDLDAAHDVVELRAEPHTVLPSSQYSNNLYHFAESPRWILKGLADGYLIANVFRLLEKEIKMFVL